MKELFRFDRFVDGILMAEGAKVYADNEAEAAAKARKLFEREAYEGEMDRTKFVRADAG